MMDKDFSKKFLYLGFVLLVLLSACKNRNPKVLISTDIGDIVVELFSDKAPVTVANFLRYIQEDRFQGSAFYRVVHLNNQPRDSIRIQVIQGGLGNDPDSLMLPAIDHETTMQTGIKHRDGVISMARWKPGTATSEFFICVDNQPELDFSGKRNPDLQGFAAFGKVVNGMDIVEEIQMLPEKNQMLIEPVKINKIEIINNYK